MNKVRFLYPVHFFYTILLSLTVSLSASAAAKLNFQLPPDPAHQIETKIENVYASNNLMVVMHSLGVSVSRDGGRSFNDVELPIGSRDAKKNAKIHVDAKDNAIYITFNGGLYKSKDAGRTFSLLKSLPYDGIDSIASNGSTVITAAYEYNFGAPTNHIYLSSNGGRSFERKSIGDELETPFTFVTSYQDRFYVKGAFFSSFLVLRSNGDGGSFESIQSNDSDWLEITDAINRPWVAVREKLQTLILPEMKPFSLPNFSTPDIKIRYTNENFNTDHSALGIWYEFRQADGSSHLIQAADAPRYACWDSSTGAVYYATFTEMYKID